MRRRTTRQKIRALIYLGIIAMLVAYSHGSESTTVTSIGTSYASNVTSIGTTDASNVTSIGTSYASNVTSIGTTAASNVTSIGTTAASNVTNIGTTDACTITSAASNVTSMDTSDAYSVTSEANNVTSIGTTNACNITSDTINVKYVSLIRECVVRDRVTLDSCLYQMLERLRPLLPAGVPELHLPPLEPLQMDKVTFSQGEGLTVINAEFTQLEVRGLSNYTTEYSSSDPRRFRFKMGLRFPRLEIKGVYNISGNIIFIPIIGNGPFMAQLYDVKADLYNWLDVVKVPQEVTTSEKPLDSTFTNRYIPLKKRNNKPRMKKELKLVNTQTDFKLGKSKLRLNNLFAGDPFLGEMVNSFLNDNAHDILNEMKPQLTKKLNVVVGTVFGDAFNQLPFKHWHAAAKYKEIMTAGEAMDIKVVTLEQ